MDAQHLGEVWFFPNLSLTWGPVMDAVLIADFSSPQTLRGTHTPIKIYCLVHIQEICLQLSFT